MSSSRNYLSAFEEFLQQNNCPAPPPTCGPSSDADQDGGHVQAVEAVDLDQPPVQTVTIIIITNKLKYH